MGKTPIYLVPESGGENEFSPDKELDISVYLKHQLLRDCSISRVVNKDHWKNRKSRNRPMSIGMPEF